MSITTLSIFIGAALVVLGLSARWNWWRAPKKGIPILMYHKIGDPPLGSKLKKLWVSVPKFRAQMEYISKKGYRPITFHDLYNHWDGIKPLPGNPILITLDDGYLNNYTDALPVLREFGFPATIYVVVQTVGWENHWHDPNSETRIPMVSWAQLKELQKAGWEIGSHTMNHPRLEKIEKKEAEIEIEKSRRIIGEFLEQVPQSFAYPYGNGADNSDLHKLVRETGYRTAVSVHSGKWTQEQMKSIPLICPACLFVEMKTCWTFIFN